MVEKKGQSDCISSITPVFQSKRNSFIVYFMTFSILDSFLDLTSLCLTHNGCRLLTHNRLVDGNVKMPMTLQTQCNERVKISEVNTSWCMVYNVTPSRETSTDHMTRIHK
jgi:hypothetical protein